MVLGKNSKLTGIMNPLMNILKGNEHKIERLFVRPVGYVTPIPKSCSPDDAGSRFLKLSNGMLMPTLGLGTWGSLGCHATQAVMEAVEVGYKMIDCAHVYENEEHVGNGLEAIFRKGQIQRDDLFIITKLWNTFHRPDLVEPAIRTSLNDLKLDFVDLYLMQWPMAYLEGEILFPRDACGNTKFSNVDYVDTWKSMENLVKLGLTKSIGLANFNKAQIDRILACCSIKPVVNQVECHPFLTQHKLMDYCKKKNIAFISYSPLGSPNRPWARKDEERLMDIKVMEVLSLCYDKTPAQILIRYQIQRGNAVIPKSVTKERIISNSQVFDWKLQDHHMRDLDDLNKNHRYVGLFKYILQHMKSLYHFKSPFAPIAKLVSTYIFRSGMNFNVGQSIHSNADFRAASELKEVKHLRRISFILNI